MSNTAKEGPVSRSAISAAELGSSSIFTVTSTSSRIPTCARSTLPRPPTAQAAGPCTDIDTDAMGFMGNVLVPIRIQGAPKWRPYGSAGLGVIHAWSQGEPVDRDQNDLAFNGGAGLQYLLSNRIGLRGDLRYFRAFVDEDKADGVYFNDYGFWRATLGVTFGFPR